LLSRCRSPRPFNSVFRKVLFPANAQNWFPPDLSDEMIERATLASERGSNKPGKAIKQRGKMVDVKNERNLSFALRACVLSVCREIFRYAIAEKYERERRNRISEKRFRLSSPRNYDFTRETASRAHISTPWSGTSEMDSTGRSRFVSSESSPCC